MQLKYDLCNASFCPNCKINNPQSDMNNTSSSNKTEIAQRVALMGIMKLHKREIERGRGGIILG